MRYGTPHHIVIQTWNEKMKNVRLKLELLGSAMLQSCVFTVHMTCIVSRGLLPVVLEESLL